MPNETNIIDIVKELQNWHSFGVENHELEYFNAEMEEHFPSIAQALLIAYRVLDNHKHLVRGECVEGCDMCQAISEINSLSSPQ